MARKKNPINDIGNQVGAWLGGPVRQAIASTPARAVENLQNAVTNNPIGIAVQRAMSGAQTFRNEGYLSAVQQQAKFAGTDIALSAAGVVGGKAGSAVGRAAAKTGIPARIANKLTGQTVVLHGTGEVLKNPKTGVPYRFNAQGKPLDKGAYLEPRAGSPALPDTPAVFGWNPKNLDGYGNIENQLQIYSSQARNFGYGTQSADFVPQRQVVVGKAKTRTVRPQGTNTAIQEVLGPVKIKQIVKTDLPMMDYYDQLGLAAKRAGAKTSHPTYKDKLERSIKKAIQKRKDRNNPF